MRYLFPRHNRSGRCCGFHSLSSLLRALSADLSSTYVGPCLGAGNSGFQVPPHRSSVEKREIFGGLPAPQAGFPPRPRQEDCVSLIPVSQTGFSLLNNCVTCSIDPVSKRN